ncbi:MAG TPA: hypothetical protein VF662_12810 [Allosphingosinicella sp.]|jgi:hypothetical protein
MRTIAGTFPSLGEAEAAGRRLEAFGIPPGAIKVQAAPGGALGGSGGVVLTAKVPPEHVQAASGILAGRATKAAEPAISPGAAPAGDAASGHVYFGGPADGAARPPRPQPAAATPRRESAGDADEQARWWRRFVLMTGAALLIAFFVGALLGLVVPE